MLKLNTPSLTSPPQRASEQPGTALQPPAHTCMATGGHKRSAGDVVITASHFLPDTQLPFSRAVAELSKAVGCSELRMQLDQVRWGQQAPGWQG